MLNDPSAFQNGSLDEVIAIQLKFPPLPSTPLFSGSVRSPPSNAVVPAPRTVNAFARGTARTQEIA